MINSIFGIVEITLEGQIDDAAGGHTGGGGRVDVVPRRVGIDANATARQHDEILHGQFGEAVDVDFGPVGRFRAEQHRVNVRMDRLQLLGRGLSRSKSQAAVHRSRFLKAGPNALQTAAVLRMGAVAAAHALVPQHEAVVG